MTTDLQILDDCLCFDIRKYNERFSVQDLRFWRKAKILNIRVQPKTAFTSECKICDVQFEDGFVENGIYFTDEFIAPLNSFKKLNK